MRFAVGRGKFPIGAEMRAAVLEGVAGFAQMLNAVVERNDARDFVAHRLAGFAFEQVRAFGISRGGEFAQDFPFGARFADLTRNFRAEKRCGVRWSFRCRRRPVRSAFWREAE